jgi:hypothetical protein
VVHARPQDDRVIRNAVIHITSEQPLVADLFETPTASDVTLHCTNLRTLDGKRPVFADDKDSVFIFPWILIRFLEIPPASMAKDGSMPLAIAAGVRPGFGPDGAAAAEPDLEIDEDFLRRIREV